MLDYLTEDEIEALEIMKKLGNLDESPIGFTAYLAPEFPRQQLDFEPFAELLNREINLKKYGNVITSITMAFIIFPVPKYNLEEEIVFFEADKVLSFAYPINYEQLLNADEETMFELMKEAFLDGVEFVFSEVSLKNFNSRLFIQDVKRLVDN